MQPPSLYRMAEIGTPVTAADLNKTAQTECKNSNRFWENRKKSIFFDLIFSSYKNFPFATFWYDLHAGMYSRCLKFERNRNSQFRYVKKIKIRIVPYGRGPGKKR